MLFQVSNIERQSRRWNCFGGYSCKTLACAAIVRKATLVVAWQCNMLTSSRLLLGSTPFCNGLLCCSQLATSSHDSSGLAYHCTAAVLAKVRLCSSERCSRSPSDCAAYTAGVLQKQQAGTAGAAAVHAHCTDSKILPIFHWSGICGRGTGGIRQSLACTACLSK